VADGLSEDYGSLVRAFSNFLSEPLCNHRRCDLLVIYQQDASPRVSTNDANGEMPHHRRCDIAQDSPGNLNPEGGNAIMFGLCGGVDDLPTGAAPSRHHFWNAYNCGYQAYRQGKVFGANPYYNDELETRWSAGWKDAQKACRTGKGPFDK
jgi:hypothetical protein